jgi:hypothetical protein
MNYDQPAQTAEMDNIVRGREALAASTEGTYDRARLRGDLAEALRAGYEQFSDIALLDEAIALHRAALELCLQENQDRSTACGRLAESLRTRCQRIEDVALLDEAIALHREAFTLSPVRNESHVQQ